MKLKNKTKQPQTHTHQKKTQNQNPTPKQTKPQPKNITTIEKLQRNSFSTHKLFQSTYHRSVSEKEAEVEPYPEEISDESELQQPQPIPRRYRTHNFINMTTIDTHLFPPFFFF